MLKMQRALVGIVFDADGFAGAAGESEGDALVGAREAGGAIEGDVARFDAGGAPSAGTGFFRRVRRLRRSWVDLHFAAATDVAGLLVVLAAVRADHVVAVAGFAEDGDDYFFEEAGVLAIEFGGFGGFHLENRVVLFDFFEIDAGGLARDIVGAAGGAVCARCGASSRA